MIGKKFDSELLYNKIVHFYVDKKGYTKDQANSIAQSVIKREIERRLCNNNDCRHSLEDHIRNSGTCLKVNCTCRNFVKD